MKGGNPNKHKKAKGDKLNKADTFIELNSFAWRQPELISVEDLLDQVKIPKPYDISKDIDKKTIVLDPHTLKIKVDDSFENDSNVIHDPLKKSNINPYKPPKDVSIGSYLHLRSDENYLYIWVGNRWKRVKLEEWDDK
jgi:hypothetical protein